MTNDAKTVFEQYIVGNIIDSFIVGVICYFGALVLKLPYASMIALIIGVTNVIPVFGPFLGAIPVIIILCLIDPFSALIFAIFIFILQQCDGNIIKPIVLGDKLGMSGFWILFSSYYWWCIIWRCWYVFRCSNLCANLCRCT